MHTMPIIGKQHHGSRGRLGRVPQPLGLNLLPRENLAYGGLAT
ncbi:MAG: hypothetical protein P4L74_07285 [Candidatus Doudnabacteria bacterium]|nr:hypothetical protein [Candidatus Doudnabacteria bacterium]